MKKVFFFLFVISVTYSFAQEASNSVFNYSKSTDEALVSNSLNLNAFKLKTTKGDNIRISNLLKENDVKRSELKNTLPIYTPKGLFFFKIYGTSKDENNNTRIFQIESSKYYWRTVG